MGFIREKHCFVGIFVVDGTRFQRRLNVSYPSWNGCVGVTKTCINGSRKDVKLFGLENTKGIDDECFGLWNWIERNGGIVNKVRIGWSKDAYGSDLRGLELTQDVNVGEIVVQVPYSVVISDSIGSESISTRIESGLTWNTQGIPWNVQNILQLLQYKHEGPKSEYKEYINSLPFETLQLPKDSDSEEELNAFCDTLFQAEVEGLYFYSEQLYESVQELIQIQGKDQKVIDRKEFRWAMNSVHSRTFLVDCGVHGLRRLLVPLIDLCNHSGNNTKQVTTEFCFDNKSDSVVLRAVRDCFAQELVTFSYGNHSNSHFANYYGFVPQENEWNVARIRCSFQDAISRVALKKSENLFEQQRYDELMRINAGFVDELHVMRCRLSEDVVRALRVLLIEEEELEMQLNQDWNLLDPGLHSNSAWIPELERAVASTLHAQLDADIQRIKRISKSFDTQSQTLATQYRNAHHQTLMLASEKLAMYASAAEPVAPLLKFMNLEEYK
uniref:SET domain-containing protein n=1 Tax=Timspurckia oligopyrenoides TaxID=708627 RepID=A0A7S0ZIQ1_9RHOD|mmetsp:Transcript_6263/g.11157  ORF Transcript_6263/g.11157 Transcript_6263/m.11157 type:complete len:498 (+) Transcript_6263:219-1712(+)